MRAVVSPEHADHLAMCYLCADGALHNRCSGNSSYILGSSAKMARNVDTFLESKQGIDDVELAQEWSELAKLYQRKSVLAQRPSSYSVLPLVPSTLSLQALAPNDRQATGVHTPRLFQDRRTVGGILQYTSVMFIFVILPVWTIYVLHIIDILRDLCSHTYGPLSR